MTVQHSCLSVGGLEELWIFCPLVYQCALATFTVHNKLVWYPKQLVEIWAGNLKSLPAQTCFLPALVQWIGVNVVHWTLIFICVVVKSCQSGLVSALNCLTYTKVRPSREGIFLCRTSNKICSLFSFFTIELEFVLTLLRFILYSALMDCSIFLSQFPELFNLTLQNTVNPVFKPESGRYIVTRMITLMAVSCH